jgi:hypothetical protein
VFVQEVQSGVAAQEPDQLGDDGLEVQLLGGEQGKTVSQIEAHGAAEEAQGAHAGAVAASLAARQHLGQQVEVLPLAGPRADEGITVHRRPQVGRIAGSRTWRTAPGPIACGKPANAHALTLAAIGASRAPLSRQRRLRRRKTPPHARLL